MTAISDEARDVILERVGGVSVVTLNNPSRRNALTPDSADRLVKILDQVNADRTVGAVVLQGADGTFCSGADLSSLESAMDDPAGEEAYEVLERIYRAFTRLGELDVPTIAAVRGSAVGAGVNLAMAADVRVMAHDARVISGFTRIGLHPGGGHLQLVAKATTREVATVMAVLSQEISGRRAAELGLAWESVEDEVVEERALSLATSAGADPDLTRKVKQSLRVTTPDAVPWLAALQAERAPQLWSLRRAASQRPKS